VNLLSGDGLLELALRLEDSELLLSKSSSGVTTNASILTIEVLGNLLKWGVAGLDEEEVDDDKLNGEPAAVDNIVLPLNVLESNWVDVVVEEESQVDEHEHDGHTTSTDLEWENLDGVTDKETGPSQVVTGIVEEDESDDGVTGSLGAVVGSVLGGDCPWNEHDEHTTSGGQEERTTTGTIDSESHRGSDKHVPDVENTVDDKLGVCIGDTNLVENGVDVVGNERVTRPLGEETGENADNHTMTVTLGGPELRDTLGKLGLEGNSLLDLLEFEKDKLVLGVSTTVVLGEDSESLLVAIDGDQPTWGFWDPENERNHDNSWSSLEDGWNSPRPVVLNAVGTIGGPGGNNRSDVPGGVVERGDTSTMLHVSELSNEKWGGAVSKRDTEPDEVTGTSEHRNVGSGRLESNTDEHDSQTNQDGETTSTPISEEWRDWDSANRTSRHDGVEKTELSSIGMEVLFPSWDGLETVHHRSIETVGGRDQDDSTEEEVKLPELRKFGPLDERELAPTEDVVSWNSTAGTHCELS